MRWMVNIEIIWRCIEGDARLRVGKKLKEGVKAYEVNRVSTLHYHESRPELNLK